MVAYRRVNDSRHLQADCQLDRDQLRNPTLGNRVWAAFCACVSQVAAVGNITVYVRRYYVRHDVRRILTVVPGLEAKMASAAASGSDDQPEAAEAAAENRIAARPTAGTSHALF